MPGRLEGKVALVTGGGSGIGRATALLFAREGAKVVVSDIDTDGGEETVDMISQTGGEATFVRADVTKEEEVAALIDRVVDAYGRLDCAHNNAGIIQGGWEDVINTNLKGVCTCMQYEILRMLEQGGGAIVNTASITGLVGTYTAPGLEGPPSYAASKYGVVGATKSTALDYAKSNIRVNAVCPGIIRTPVVEKQIAITPEIETEGIKRYPMGRFGEPEEVAEAVVWLCSDAASFVTGVAMPIDGGFTAQ